jgi:hypothetical protein
MGEGYPDLLETLAAVHQQTHSPRAIWCAPAVGFETTVSTRRGVLFGGAWSPAFLHDTTSATPLGVPWVVILAGGVRLALVESATAPVGAWVSLLEAVQEANESFLLLAQVIDRTLLRTLSVNAAHGGLTCCAARLSAGGSDDGIWDGGPNIPPPPSPKGLPLAAEAWIRRSATVVFPADSSSNIGRLEDVSVIAVGGQSLESQQQRLRYLVQAVEALKES